MWFFSPPIDVMKMKVTENSASSFTVLAGYVVDSVGIKNTTSNALTGGLKLGSTVGCVDFATAVIIGANSGILLMSFLTPIYANPDMVMTVYPDAVTLWNSVSSDLTINFKKVV